MQRSHVFIVALLLAVPLLAAAIAAPASATDVATIPIDRQIEVTPGMFANLIQLTISDTTYGGSFAPDPSKVIFPVLVYTYTNRGTVAQNGHLHVRFVDDQGQTYDGSDPGTMDAVQPGQTTGVRTIEINVPKDRKITELVVVMGFEEQTIKITYPGTTTPTPSPAPTAAAGTASPKGNACIGSVVLPLLIVGIAWAGFRITRK